MQGPQYPAQNVTTTNPDAFFGFISYMDLGTGGSLTLVNGTCNDNTKDTQYTAALNECAAQNANGCCLDMSNYTVSCLPFCSFA